MEWPTAFVIGVNSVTAEFDSARLDAPVVADRRSRHPTQRARLAMSKALYRAARLVAPAEHRPAYLRP